MQAIENEPPDQGTNTPFIERCRQDGRLQGFAPAPLGGQRERFLALVHDMRRRGSDYTSQLSMLALAGLSRREQKESKHSILADLLKQSDIKEQEAQELLLWQSRLVLKLGEFFDVQQAAVNEALGNIASRQDALLAELREEEDNPFALAAGLGETDQETDGMLDHRLKAWSRLCLHDAGQPQGILVTCRPSAMDRLQEMYEKNHRRNAVLWASLELPAFAASGEETTASEPLIAQCPQLIAALEATSLVSGATLPEEEIKRLLTEGATQWAQGLDARASVRRDQCRVLELYRFPEISARQLLQEGFAGGDPANPASLAGLSAPSSGCVVGLLRNK